MTHGWPDAALHQLRRYDAPESPAAPLNGHWFLWPRQDGDRLVRLTGGPDALAIQYTRDLQPAATGATRNEIFGNPVELVEFRSNDERLPPAMRGVWQLGVAAHAGFGPIRIGGHKTSKSDAPRGYSFAYPHDEPHKLLVYPIDWFGDDFELGALPCRLADLENVEFRAVPPAADLLRQEPTASAPRD